MKIQFTLKRNTFVTKIRNTIKRIIIEQGINEIMKIRHMYDQIIAGTSTY